MGQLLGRWVRLRALVLFLLLVRGSSAAAVETCSFVVSPGDAGVGIAAVTDQVCKTAGGLGCFSGSSVCRYCKTKSTAQSQHLLDCSAIVQVPASTPAPATPAPAPAPTTPAPVTTAPAPAPTTSNAPVGGGSSVPMCPQVASPGDAAVGISIVADTSCASGGLGCIDKICRFCKNRDTAQSGHYLTCQSINPGYGSIATPAPAPPPASTPAPQSTTSAPVSTTVSPATPSPSPPPPSPSETCSSVVSPGDASVGIVVLTDASCKTLGGVGCFGPTSVCRYCKSKSTPQSDHLRTCDSFVSSAPSSSASTNPTVAPSTPAPAATPSPFSPSVSGGALAQTPPPADSCSDMLIATSLATTGVWAVFDPSCPRDGDLGDCNQFCRMCKFAESSASTALRTCSSVLATVAAAAMDSGVWSPADLMLPDTPPASQCTTTLAPDTVNTGIWMTLTCLASDPSSGACLQAQCDYCKYFETQSSSDYPPCGDPVSIIDSA